VRIDHKRQAAYIRSAIEAGAEIVRCGECDECGSREWIFTEGDRELDPFDRPVRYGYFECTNCGNEEDGSI
jgi:hypothetical protein